MRWALDIVVVAGLALSSAAPVQAQTSEILFMAALDARGAAVTDLGVEEFVVFEDDAERKVASVELVSLPVKLALLVDNSATASPGLSDVREGLRELVALLPDDMEVSLVTTSPQPRIVVRLTSDKAELSAGIDLISPDSGSGAFVDAISEAMNRFVDDDDAFIPTLLVIAANGPDTASGLDRKFGGIQDDLQTRPTIAHVIVLSAARSGGEVQTTVGTTIADVTGGRYEALASPSRFRTLLPEFAEQIGVSHERQRAQYRITYIRPAGAEPPTQGIGAETRRPGLQGILSLDGRMP